MRKKEILKGNDKMNGDEFKQKFYDKIAWVNLLFTWEERHYSPTKYKAELKDGKIVDVYIVWLLKRKDPDYSFNGSPEDAIKFMDEYDLWDDLEESDIHDLVLEKTNEELSDCPPDYLKKGDLENCVYLENLGLYYVEHDNFYGIYDEKRIFKARN